MGRITRRTAAAFLFLLLLIPSRPARALEPISTCEPDGMQSSGAIYRICMPAPARWNGDLIVMDAEQTIKVCEMAKIGIVIAALMEALDHATLSRSELRAAADAHGIPLTKLVIPDDGEVLTLIPPVV